MREPQSCREISFGLVVARTSTTVLAAVGAHLRLVRVGHDDTASNAVRRPFTASENHRGVRGTASGVGGSGRAAPVSHVSFANAESGSAMPSRTISAANHGRKRRTLGQRASEARKSLPRSTVNSMSWHVAVSRARGVAPRAQLREKRVVCGCASRRAEAACDGLIRRPRPALSEGIPRRPLPLAGHGFRVNRTPVPDCSSRFPKTIAWTNDRGTEMIRDTVVLAISGGHGAEVPRLEHRAHCAVQLLDDVFRQWEPPPPRRSPHASW